MTEKDLLEDLGNQFIVIGPSDDSGKRFGLFAKTTFSYASIFTDDWRAIEKWLLPNVIEHPMNTQLTRSSFHAKVAIDWWERRSGHHGGGSFNEKLYLKYLEVVYG
jgi:hypothetical protein